MNTFLITLLTVTVISASAETISGTQETLTAPTTELVETATDLATTPPNTANTDIQPSVSTSTVMPTIKTIPITTPEIKNLAPIKSKSKKVSPDKLLAQSIYTISNFLKNSGATDLTKILYFVDNEISPYFDFNRMTQLALGRHGRNLNRQQINRVTVLIKRSFIEALANKLVGYSFANRRIRFLPAQRSRFGSQIVVRLIISHPNRYHNRLTFKFHPTKNGWKIYDATANGRSAVVFYRQKFNRIIFRSGIQALVR